MMTGVSVQVETTINLVDTFEAIPICIDSQYVAISKKIIATITRLLLTVLTIF